MGRRGACGEVSKSINQASKKKEGKNQGKSALKLCVAKAKAHKSLL